MYKMDIYSRCLLTRHVTLPVTAIDKNIQGTIGSQIAAKYEGICVAEGFVKRGSAKLVTHSSGRVLRTSDISFEVVFECDVCFPVENMHIECVAKNITKAGVRCESSVEVPSPIVVFIARDHNQDLSSINEGDKIKVRVIGQRFELNDKYVSVIGEII
jgi:hypothetical protein